MKRKTYEKWPGYSTADCDCRMCLYYGGHKQGEIICRADECCCKEEFYEALKREKGENNGSKDQQGNT